MDLNISKNISAIQNKSEAQKLLSIASLAGRIILENGGEVYRAEDTVIRICESRENIRSVDAFSTPTAIFISLNFQGEIITNLKRTKTSSINLHKISRANEFSRNFVGNPDLDLDQAYGILQNIQEEAPPSSRKKILSGMIASIAFCIIFGGGFREAVATLISSFFMLFTLEKLKVYQLTFFINTFIGALVASLFTLLTVKLNIPTNIDSVIIGSIMCLAPGVAITNSLRDTFRGDIVSGLTRMMEAVVTALAIAMGVGLVLNIYIKGMI